GGRRRRRRVAHQLVCRRRGTPRHAPLVDAAGASGTEGRLIWAARPIAGRPGRPYRGPRVAYRDSALDRRALRARGEPPQVDLVGVLGLPPLLREAQGLRLWRDRPLEDVHLRARVSSLSAPPSTSGPGRGPFKAVARVRIPLGALAWRNCRQPRPRARLAFTVVQPRPLHRAPLNAVGTPARNPSDRRP